MGMVIAFKLICLTNTTIAWYREIYKADTEISQKQIEEMWSIICWIRVQHVQENTQEQEVGYRTWETRKFPQQKNWDEILHNLTQYYCNIWPVSEIWRSLRTNKKMIYYLLSWSKTLEWHSSGMANSTWLNSTKW